MELEYKWMLPQGCTFQTVGSHPLIAEIVQNRTEFDMLGRYYDTQSHLFQRLGGTLRFRKENDHGVACMKITKEKIGAKALREEYEAEADNLIDGLHKLPDAGAPAALCEAALNEDMILLLCETDFHRSAWTLKIPSDAGETVAELAMDKGFFRRENRSQAFEEIELEFKSGDEAAFHAFCGILADTFGLIPQSLSKLARAMAV